MNELVDNDKSIFKFVNPIENDSLSNMKGKDLQELIYRLNKYYLEYRNKLNFDKNVSFGFELEFEYANALKIEEELIELNKKELLDIWTLVSDVTLVNGAEIDSPILRDDIKYWQDLRSVCNIVKENAIIGNNSAGHIHIGTQVLGGRPTHWLNFMKLWSVYEKVIFRFLYGEQLTARSSLNDYASCMQKKFMDQYLNVKAMMKNMYISPISIISKVKFDRHEAVNFDNCNRSYLNEELDRNTIEFRCPNGTLEPVIWQNNLNLLVNILLYSKSKNYDDEKIDLRNCKNKDKYLELQWYDEIYLIDALELCDMLFNNNIDKIYFLRQYLKNFEIYNGNNIAKCFIKK